MLLVLAPTSTGLTILNKGGVVDREDYYYPAIVWGYRAKIVDITSQVTQVLNSVAYSNIYLFDKFVVWGKPFVAPVTYRKLTTAQKSEVCTLETSDTYIVFDELSTPTSGYYTLDELKGDYRVFKVAQVEHKTMGTPDVRHIKVSLK